MKESEPDPLRVSEWSATPAPAPDPARRDVPLEAVAERDQETQEPETGLPLDPMRFLGGLWKRRRWIVIGIAAGAVLGLGFGLLKAKTRYMATVQLIKRDLPSSFRINDTGEAFRPRQLSGGTLVGAAASANVLQRVALKATPPVSVGELESSIEVKEQRNTDFVFLTLSGFTSAAATVDLANLWANEAVQFTRELQSQESKEMRQFLQQEVDSTDSELKKLNEQILEFSRRENLVDAS